MQYYSALIICRRINWAKGREPRKKGAGAVNARCRRSGSLDPKSPTVNLSLGIIPSGWRSRLPLPRKGC